MSDSGMVVHWWRTRGPGWKKSIVINGADAVLTSSILVIVAVTKFALGAWIYYNTNVVNRYVPGDVAKRQQAEYEKLYRQYRDLPQPKITDVRTDVFSLGVIAAETVTGRRPFEGRTVSELMLAMGRPISLPGSGPAWRRLEGIIQRAVGEHPSDRFPSVDALLAELLPALDALPAGIAT